MLAEPLLRARAKNGIITPVFCTTGKELELAERIIGEFQASWENKEKKSELDSRIDAIISESLQGGTRGRLGRESGRVCRASGRRGKAPPYRGSIRFSRNKQVVACSRTRVPPTCRERIGASVSMRQPYSTKQK